MRSLDFFSVANNLGDSVAFNFWNLTSSQRSDGQALSYICRAGSDIDRPDPREASGRFPSQKRSGCVFHRARCDCRDLKTGGFRALAVTGFEEGPKGWGYSFGPWPLGRAKTAGQQRWGSFEPIAVDSFSKSPLAILRVSEDCCSDQTRIRAHETRSFPRTSRSNCPLAGRPRFGQKDRRAQASEICRPSLGFNRRAGCPRIPPAQLD
jgi:hypothetical protein